MTYFSCTKDDVSLQVLLPLISSALEISSNSHCSHLQDARIKLIPCQIGVLASYNRDSVALRPNLCAHRSAGVSPLPPWPSQIQWPLLRVLF